MITHGLPSRRLLGAFVGLIVGLALPVPAAAFLRDVELLRPPGVVLNGAALPISCFNGKALLGIGAEIHPVVSTGWLAINRMWPREGRADQALVGSVNTNPGRGRALWGISGQVSCAAYTDTPPTAANGGPYLKDPVLVRNASVLSSSQLRIVDADCAGRRPIGGGFKLVSTRPGVPPAHVAVDRAEIVGRQFRVVAHETALTRARWSLEAYAVCVNYTDPLPGQVYVGPGPLTYTDTSRPTPGCSSAALHCPDRVDGVVISAGCPANWYAIGGGARVTGASITQSPPPEVALTRLEPAPRTLGSPRFDFWIAGAAEEIPTDQRWRLQVTAICAPLVAPSG